MEYKKSDKEKELIDEIIIHLLLIIKSKVI